MARERITNLVPAVPEPLFTLDAVRHAADNLKTQAEFMNEYAHDYITRVLFAAREYLEERDRDTSFGYVVCCVKRGTPTSGPREYLRLIGLLTADLSRCYACPESQAKEVAEYRNEKDRGFTWFVDKFRLDQHGRPVPYVSPTKKGNNRTQVVYSVNREFPFPCYVRPSGSRSPYKIDAALYTKSEATKILKAGQANEPESEWQIADA